MTVEWMIDVLGWVGAGLLLLAYAMVSAERWRGGSFKFQSLNVAGSVLLIVNTVHYGAYPSAVVNAVWIGIAVYTLVR
ncbi:MAG: hypothetical protein ACE5GE_09145 [Phycisphaerae bacterium]